MPKSFQSTLPVWGATYGEFLIEVVICHFNPRSPCGERHRGRTVKWHKVVISIHAPRVGSDPERKLDCYAPVLFQSTLPVWGATKVLCPVRLCTVYFNPRSPCGERHGMGTPICPMVSNFNPRSPCGERLIFLNSFLWLRIFQSTLPVWGATGGHRCFWYERPYFNPRSPCGERPCAVGALRLQCRFQSTLPVWGATGRTGGHHDAVCISIHAPRVGSDSHNLSHVLRHARISIHAPRVGSDLQPVIVCQPEGVQISIHAPRVGSDPSHKALDIHVGYFNPRSPCGERLRLSLGAADVTDFNPRSPCGERPDAQDVTALDNQFQSTLPVWGATRSLTLCR